MSGFRLHVVDARPRVGRLRTDQITLTSWPFSVIYVKPKRCQGKWTLNFTYPELPLSVVRKLIGGFYEWDKLETLHLDGGVIGL